MVYQLKKQLKILYLNKFMQKKIVIISENDFRDEETIYPLYRFQEEKWIVDVATDQKKLIKGKFGIPIQGTIGINELKVDNYDAVIIPGGNEGPDRLRMNREVLKFVKEMYEKNKITAAICHGVWILISAKITMGKKATCYQAIIDDLKNSGAKYEDKPVVIDGKIITSRHPRDLPIFTKTIIDLLKM